MTNIEIKSHAMTRGVKLWQIADQLRISEATMTCMRQAAHRILYTVANSNAMNEIGVVVSTMNWWQFSLIDGIIFSALAAVICLALTVVDIVKFNKSRKGGAK